MGAAGVAPWRLLEVWEGQVVSGVIGAAHAACPSGSRLLDRVVCLVDGSLRHRVWLTNRLFPLCVLGSLTSDPAAAIPVSVVSTLWWVGAEALDEIADARDGGVRDAPAQMVAAIACGTVIAERYLDRLPLTEVARQRLTREYSAGSLAAAEGQLADLERGGQEVTWAGVMRTYAGKTGAPYGRDAAMAAAVAGLDEVPVRAWRTFGRMFGVLRQAHNDSSDGDRHGDEDLANGTPTLLMAYALAIADPPRRASLLHARAAARHDRATRGYLRRMLDEPGLRAGYSRRIWAIHRHACSLLNQLAADSPYREALRLRLDVTAALACQGHSAVEMAAVDAG